MVRTTRCPTCSTISPHRVAAGSALIGIAAAFTTSSRSRARDSFFEWHGRLGVCTHLFFAFDNLNNLVHRPASTATTKGKGLIAMGSIVELPAIKPRSTRRRQGLRKLSPDLISEARDETGTQVTRIGLTFLGTAAFCLLSLLSPDSALLGGNEKIS